MPKANNKLKDFVNRHLTNSDRFNEEDRKKIIKELKREYDRSQRIDEYEFDLDVDFLYNFIWKHSLAGFRYWDRVHDIYYGCLHVGTPLLNPE